jgi:hypothetical protein
MSEPNTSTTSEAEPTPFELQLASLLRLRGEYVNKIEEIDNQIANALQDKIPSTNNISLRLVKAGLTVSPINFENTFLDYRRINKPPLVIAQRNRVLLNYPGYSEVTLAAPPGPSTVRTDPPLLTETFPRAETPTRNVINPNELVPFESLLEAYLANNNA